MQGNQGERHCSARCWANRVPLSLVGASCTRWVAAAGLGGCSRPWVAAAGLGGCSGRQRRQPWRRRAAAATAAAPLRRTLKNQSAAPSTPHFAQEKPRHRAASAAAPPTHRCQETWQPWPRRRSRRAAARCGSTRRAQVGAGSAATGWPADRTYSIAQGSRRSSLFPTCLHRRTSRPGPAGYSGAVAFGRRVGGGQQRVPFRAGEIPARLVHTEWVRGARLSCAECGQPGATVLCKCVREVRVSRAGGGGAK